MTAALALGGIAQAQTGRSGGTGTGMSGSGVPNTSDASGTSMGSGTSNADKQNDKMVNKKAKKSSSSQGRSMSGDDSMNSGVSNPATSSCTTPGSGMTALAGPAK